jgi:hypothetical protein
MFKTPLQKNGTLSTLRQVLASNNPMVSWKRQSRQSKRVDDGKELMMEKGI